MNCKRHNQLGAHEIHSAVAVGRVPFLGAGDGLAQDHTNNNHIDSDNTTLSNNNNRSAPTESHVCLANAPTPGSYNSSELTTEATELMEESSGAQAPAAEEVDRRTSASPPTIDLNIPSSESEEGHGREEHLNRNRRDRSRGEEEHGNEATGSDDWLELRLGPPSNLGGSREQERKEYAGDECEDETQQKSAPKHLFPPRQTVPSSGYSSMTMATTSTPHLMDFGADTSRVGDRASSRELVLTGPSLAAAPLGSPERSSHPLFGTSTSREEEPDVHHRTFRHEHASDMPVLQSNVDRAGVAGPALHGASGGYSSYAGLLGADDSRPGSSNLPERSSRTWGDGPPLMVPPPPQLPTSYQHHPYHHPGHEDYQASLARRLHDSNNSFLAGAGPSFSGSGGALSEDWRDILKRASARSHVVEPTWYTSFPIRSGGSGGHPSSSSSWSSHLLGSGQNISTPSRMPFDFLHFHNRLPLSGAAPWQASGHSGGLLPGGGTPPSQHLTGIHDTTTSTSTSREVHRSPNDIWCSLLPIANSNVSEQLPELPRQYIHLNDANVGVSHVKKYLVGKLGLSCESEVEILCRGQVLSSKFSLENVRDTIWNNPPPATHENSTDPGRSLVMELNYGRRLHP